MEIKEQNEVKRRDAIKFLGGLVFAGGSFGIGMMYKKLIDEVNTYGQGYMEDPYNNWHPEVADLELLYREGDGTLMTTGDFLQSLYGGREVEVIVDTPPYTQDPEADKEKLFYSLNNTAQREFVEKIVEIAERNGYPAFIFHLIKVDEGKYEVPRQLLDTRTFRYASVVDLMKLDDNDKYLYGTLFVTSSSFVLSEEGPQERNPLLNHG